MIWTRLKTNCFIIFFFDHFLPSKLRYYLFYKNSVVSSRTIWQSLASCHGVPVCQNLRTHCTPMFSTLKRLHDNIKHKVYKELFLGKELFVLDSKKDFFFTIQEVNEALCWTKLNNFYTGSVQVLFMFNKDIVWAVQMLEVEIACWCHQIWYFQGERSCFHCLLNVSSNVIVEVEWVHQTLE